MKNSKLLLAFTAFSTLLVSSFFPAAQAANEGLPLCQDAYCQKIFHDKKLEQATVIVWTGESNILSSYTFPLNKSAKLVNTASEADLIAFEPQITPLNTGTPPPAPCSNSGCSTSSTTTFETATSIITVTIVFHYYNGQLLSVSSTSTEIKKPDDTRQQQ